MSVFKNRSDVIWGLQTVPMWWSALSVLCCLTDRKMHLGNMKGILPNLEFQFQKLFNCILSGRLKFLCTQCKLVEKGRAKANCSLLCSCWRCSSSSGRRPQRSPCLLRPQCQADQLGARYSTRDQPLLSATLAPVSLRNPLPPTFYPCKNLLN